MARSLVSPSIPSVRLNGSVGAPSHVSILSSSHDDESDSQLSNLSEVFYQPDRVTTVFDGGSVSSKKSYDQFFDHSTNAAQSTTHAPVLPAWIHRGSNFSNRLQQLLPTENQVTLPESESVVNAFSSRKQKDSSVQEEDNASVYEEALQQAISFASTLDKASSEDSIDDFSRSNKRQRSSDEADDELKRFVDNVLQSAKPLGSDRNVDENGDLRLTNSNVVEFELDGSNSTSGKTKNEDSAEANN